jgi:tripartite-type tricarboxylate transporter receptor subunit TctC
MNVHRRRFLRLAGVAATLPALPPMARAEPYPTRPVRVIVPYAPGGVTDVFARLVAQKLSERLGKQFYVDNVVGASGNLGTAQAAKAAADGYTLLFPFSSYVVNPTLFAKLPYDARADFEPVMLAVTSTSVLCVNPSLPASSMKDLVDLIRANPGKYNFASAGTGTQSHLAGEQFRLSLGLDLVHVPFKGGGPAVASVVAGHTPFTFIAPAPAVPQIKEGNLRALAVTAKQRSRILPDVPTVTEAGLPAIEGDSWVGVLAPAGTPKDIVAHLNREIAAIMAEPDVQERLATLGYEVLASTPEEFARRIGIEIETWGKVIRAANIQPE